MLEISIFHPMDTIIKRLMTNTMSFRGGHWGECWAKVAKVIFGETAQKGLFSKWRSLFPGLACATTYKISQRIYKFGGQPIMKDMINYRSGDRFDRAFGKHSKSMQHAVAGSLVGVGEVVLLPLDVLKIRKQTNPTSIGQGCLTCIKQEGLTLYRGASWTISRNLAGSAVLFGSSCFVKDNVFSLNNHNDASFWQVLSSSTVGTVGCLVVASPMDVVKTRIQRTPYDVQSKTSGWGIVREMVMKEGMGSFWKGIIPKIAVIGPKLIFVFTATQYFSVIIDKLVRCQVLCATT
uniref:Mitochondrial carrier protein n=1 Tax=Arcella intermedia TaxID=1963864 RepID=A0A6B2LBD1_9EUKA